MTLLRKMFRHPAIWGSMLLLLTLLVAIPEVTQAASPLDPNITNVVNGDSEGAAQFNDNMKNFAATASAIAKTVSIIMVALGGLMVAMNVDGPTKLMWNAILGVGLAISFGGFISSDAFGFMGMASSAAENLPPPAFKFPTSSGSAAPDFPSLFGGENSFPSVYMQYTRYGARQMIVPAMKLLLILTTVQASVKIALDLITGDKIKYLVEVMLHTSVYAFLILNWYGYNGSLDIMGSLMAGFEQMGYNASGLTVKMGANGQSLVASDTFGNAFQILYYGLSNAVSFSHPIMSIPALIMILFMGLLLILTGIEMLMARIEFWTLAMLTIPLIPFAALSMTRFLFQSAINAMLNLAIKVCVIAFITAVSSSMLTDYAKAFTSDHDIGTDFSLLIQGVLISLLLYMIVKKVPELVTGLISGNPQLNGATMTSMAKGAAMTGAKVGAAAVTGGAAVAKAGIQGAAAGAGFKAAGGKGLAGQALGAVTGGLNGAAGAMAKGMGGLAKNAIMGDNNNQTGGGGGLGIVNAMRQGARLGKNFDNKNKDGERMGMFSTKDGKGGQSPSVMGSVKKGIQGAINHPETKQVADMIETPMKDAKGNIMKDADGKDIMKQTPQYNEDGSMKMKTVETGRQTGIYGRLYNVKKEASDTYKNSKKTEK